MLAIKGGEPVRKKEWPQWPVFDEREIEILEEVVKSRSWGGGLSDSGPWEAKFEEAFAKRHGCRYGITVTSGTVALFVSLLAAGIGPGDEVIAPALTFWATGSAVLMTGATLVIVDVDPDTYCMDVNEVERSITEKTKAIIPVYNYGTSPDMDALVKLAEEHNLVLIEDCARAHGFEWKGRPAGSLGDMGCFSFQQGKFMTAGEGGIIITNNELYAERCFSIKNCGRIRRGRDISEIGIDYWWNWFNFRMTQFQAAVLLVQLERLDEQLKIRQENSEYLNKRLQEIDGITPIKVRKELTKHQPWPYAFKYDPKSFKGVPLHRFIEALRAEGIPASGLDHPPLNMTLAARYPSRIKRTKYPVAERAMYETVTLPQWVFLGTKEDMDDIVEAIIKIQKHADEL